MQVRAGGPTGGAHSANGLALGDTRAALHGNAAQVGIHGGVAAAVVDEHHVAKAALGAGEFDHAVTHAAHGSAGGRCVVHAQVGAPGLQNGVKAHLEAAAHARELHGRGQVGLAQALPVERVIRAFGPAALGGGWRAWDGRRLHGRVAEPQGLESFAVVDELGVQHFAGFEGFAVGFQGFVINAETVALAQAAVKVDVAREDAGDLRGHGVGDVGFVGGGEQRGLDVAAGDAGRDGVGRCLEA